MQLGFRTTYVRENSRPLWYRFAIFWIIIGAVAVTSIFSPRAIFLSSIREINKIATVMRTNSMEEVETDYFVIRYNNVDEKMVDLVGSTAEKYLTQVIDDFEYQLEEKPLIIVYSSREEMGKAFGWPAEESAMGVYWAGVLRVLSPDQWIAEDNEESFQNVFESSGPVVHEFTHYVIDYKTNGNYTRWLTEGIAQYEEYKLTGFMFREPEGSLRQQLYPLNKMDNEFDLLPNQSLAYKQALVAVLYIVDQYGEEGVLQLLEQLSKGTNLNSSMKKCWGITLEEFEQQMHNWIQINIENIEGR